MESCGQDDAFCADKEKDDTCCVGSNETNPHYKCDEDTGSCKKFTFCGVSSYDCAEENQICTTCTTPFKTNPWWICVSGICVKHSYCGFTVDVGCVDREGQPCGEICQLDPDCDWCWPACVCFEGLCSFTPIVIDVNGNGFNLTDAANGVDFDFVGNGTLIRSAWTASNSDDAWLVLDRNGNGTIDNGLELFGAGTAQPFPIQGTQRNGFLALAEFDQIINGGNRDGQIDRRDFIFSALQLWQDVNHNGVSEPQELRSLQDVGLVTIELNYKLSRRRDQHGNHFMYRAKVKDTRDEHVGRWAWDVILRRQ
ncbi:MAG: hypothetical protein KF868_19240 [Acidobacteria bacterium]|nr:hypothetical protein [Acidobacteriota bacterium]